MNFVQKLYVRYALSALSILLVIPVVAQQYQGAPAYQDTTHDSKVFGHDKIYRLYLPKGYEKSTRRYPVIYYFHGWGGRYNQDVNAKLEYDQLKGVVDRYGIILVMVDGDIVPSEPRPYNVGYHEDVKFQIQMKDYFLELVSHIDSTYRTLTDRRHRGIIGFSMGGFMSFYLAGKYPDKIAAAVSLAGSPEFYVGYPDNHTLYSMRYTFMNLRQVDVALRNGTTDILYYLNSEVDAGARWDEKVNFQYWTFHGPHMIDEPGETKIYEKAVKFIIGAFKEQEHTKNTPPENWSHYDLYPSFKVWDYEVKTNKDQPGFLFLRNVDKKGFGWYTEKWLPHGPAIDQVRAQITTAPAYKPGENYGLAIYNQDTKQVMLEKVLSDTAGKITLHLNDGGEIGIFTADETAEYVFLNYKVTQKDQDSSRMHYLADGPENRLHIQLFNRGGENRLAGDIKVTISTRDSFVHLKDSVVTVQAAKSQRILTLPPFILSCVKKPPPHAEPADVRFHLAVHTAWGDFSDELTVPVFFSGPALDSIRVDDGRTIRDSVYGRGNKDGRVNPGERIMLYQGSHRLRLYTEDPWVITKKEELASEIIPERWPDGYTLSSVVQISPDCPEGHEIEFLASYETKTFNPIERTVHWGRVRITVRHP